MRKKRVVGSGIGRRFVAVGLCCMACALLFSGCQLAREGEAAGQGESRLAGVLITTEYLDLFDMEGYLNDNSWKIEGGNLALEENDADGYEGRLYATLQEETGKDEAGDTAEGQRYRFDGVEGIQFFATSLPLEGEEQGVFRSFGDEAVGDGHVALVENDEGEEVSLTGVVYVAGGLENQSNRTYYVNPVYQQADGRIYATAGNGMNMSEAESEGTGWSQTLEDKVTVTENGESKEWSSRVDIKFSVMFPPEQIVLLEMDAQSQVLSREEFEPENLPEVLALGEDTGYIILESWKRDGEGAKVVSRMLYGRDCEYMDSFRLGNNGICIKQQTKLEWH